MSIDELTIKEAKEIAKLFSSTPQVLGDLGPWQIGKNYNIRTVTHYWTGRLVAVATQELVLEDATWIASTGRFSDFFSDGPEEAEPVDGPVIIGRGAIIDAELWTIALPREQK
jgi:hypothetical protein